MRLRVMVLETDNVATAAEVLAAALSETQDRKPAASTVMPTAPSPTVAKPSTHPQSRAKETKGKAGMAEVKMPRKIEQPPERVSSRLGAGRTAQASGSDAVGAIRRGRPRIGETRDKPWVKLGMTERTYYRRKAAGTLPRGVEP